MSAEEYDFRRVGDRRTAADVLAYHAEVQQLRAELAELEEETHD